MNRTEALVEAACIRVKALEVRVAGMQAENEHRLNNGNAVAYGDEAFNAIADQIEKLAAEVEQLATRTGVAGVPYAS